MIAKITSFNLQVIHLDMVTNMEGRKTGGGGVGWTKLFAVISPFGLGILGIADSLMNIVRQVAVIQCKCRGVVQDNRLNAL